MQISGPPQVGPARQRSGPDRFWFQAWLTGRATWPVQGSSPQQPLAPPFLSLSPQHEFVGAHFTPHALLTQPQVIISGPSHSSQGHTRQYSCCAARIHKTANLADLLSWMIKMIKSASIVRMRPLLCAKHTTYLSVWSGYFLSATGNSEE